MKVGAEKVTVPVPVLRNTTCCAAAGSADVLWREVQSQGAALNGLNHCLAESR